MDSLFKFLEKLGVKLAPLLATACITSFAALTLPYNYAWFAAAKPLVEPYRGWVLATLVVSTVYLFVLALGQLWKLITRQIRKRQFKTGLAKRLANLTVHERQIFSAYIHQGTRTLTWPIDEPVVNSLVAYGLLFRSSSIGDYRGFPHDVQDDVWNYLQEHPETVLR